MSGFPEQIEWFGATGIPVLSANPTRKENLLFVKGLNESEK
jgi:hypothetical protein